MHGSPACPRILLLCHLDGGHHRQLQSLYLNPQPAFLYVDLMLLLLQHPLGH